MIIDNNILDFFHSLADQASRISTHFFRRNRLELDIQKKADLSPIVTKADLIIETQLRKMIRSKYPDHGIFSEEFGGFNEDAKYLWIIDPIDGSIAFSMGKPTFTTAIGLVEDGIPIVGLLDQPVQMERWIGVLGRPTLLNGLPVSTFSIGSLDDAFLSYNGLDLGSMTRFSASLLNTFQEKMRSVSVGGDCYNYGLLSSGHTDVVVESMPDLCDFISMVPIIKGSGGCMTDWAGLELTHSHQGGVVASSTPEIHKKIINIIKSNFASHS